MPNINKLIAYSICFSLFCTMINFGIDGYGLYILTIEVIFFSIISVFYILSKIIKNAKSLNILHILIFMNFVGWLSYIVTYDKSNEIKYINSAIIVFLFNLISDFALIYIFNRLITKLCPKSSLQWLDIISIKVVALRYTTTSIFIFASIFFQAYLFSLGIVMSGAGSDVVLESSALQSIIIQFALLIQGSVIVLSLIYLICGNSKQKKIGICLFLMELILAFLSGRRALLSIIILTTFFWIVLKGFSFKKLFLSLVVMIFLVIVAGPIFQSMRSNVLDSRLDIVSTSGKFSAIFSELSSSISNYSLNSFFSQEYKENLDDRGGYLNWTILIQDQLMTKNKDYMLGLVTTFSILEIIPRIIFPNKFNIIGDTRVEQKIQAWFDMGYFDGASTLLGYGIAEAGLLGAVFYYSCLGFLLFNLFYFSLRTNYALFSIWALYAAFSLCFYTENDLTDLLNTVRYLIIIIIIEKFYFKKNYKRIL